MQSDKSLYEMSNEDLQALRPDDFTEAFIKSNDELVEEWAKTPWLKDDRGGAIPGKNARERDYNRAVIARTLQNYVNEFLGYRGRNGQGQQVPLTVMEAVDRMSKAAGAADNQFPDYDKINEAAGAATTSAWSGATTLPLVLGYARKIMPKMIALNLYAVQPLDRPTGRVFFIARNRDNNGTTDGQVEQRAGWSYRSWANDPGEVTAITKGVSFTITSTDVTATSHKLLAQTSIEVEQDLRAYFGINNTCPPVA
jgi:hypothetical protein